MNPDELEEKLNAAYQGGKAAGLNMAAKMMMDRAVAAFADRKDEKAKLYRELADDFTARSREIPCTV